MPQEILFHFSGAAEDFLSVPQQEDSQHPRHQG
jgi:hypothetical protein